MVKENGGGRIQGRCYPYRLNPVLATTYALHFSKVCGGSRRWLQRIVAMLWPRSCTLCFRFLHRTMPCAAVYIHNGSCACCCVQNFLIDRYCDMKRSKDPNLVEDTGQRYWSRMSISFCPRPLSSHPAFPDTPLPWSRPLAVAGSRRRWES